MKRKKEQAERRRSRALSLESILDEIDDQTRDLGCTAHDGPGIGFSVDEYECYNPESDIRSRYNYRKAQNGYAHNREISAAACNLLYVHWQNFILDGTPSALSDNDFIRHE